MQSAKAHVLLSAFALKPGGGSEAGLGWHVASGLAKYFNVTVLWGNLKPSTIPVEDIAALEVASRQAGCLRPILIEGCSFAKGLARFSGNRCWWWLYYEAYRRWQLQALQVARDIHAANPVDITHHITYIGFREPGYLWKLGCPHFWGPISGSPMVPWPFLRSFKRGEFYRWASRNVGNWFQMNFSNRCRRAAHQSNQIWVVSKTDRELVARKWKAKADFLLETGAESQPLAAIRTLPPGRCLRVVWCGRFDAIKCLPVVLSALNSLGEKNWSLDIIGDGAERRRWISFANTLPSAPRFHWHGFKSRSDVLDIMSKNHVLVHSSVKEGTPHVVLEAMSLGLPVVCHDACGMSTAIDSTCGIKVQLKSPANSIQGFRSAFLQLFADPELLVSLSKGALRRSEELSWKAKIETIAEAYQKAL